MSPELQRRKTMDLLAQWTLSLSAAQPLVVFVEDLHWCDASTLALLGHLIAQSATVRVLLLATARPEFTPPWPARSNLATLSLARLTKRQARDMIAALGGTELPTTTLDALVNRADGVPLFVEELTKSVMEAGATRGVEAIPASLADSLMARLDRLSAAKEVAQRAAVLGREFSYPLLAAVAGLEDAELRQGLARLVEAEIVFARGEPPEATYTFKHALVQEAAYQSLLKRTRQHLHACIAQVLPERFPELVATEPERVAHHYTEGGLGAQAVNYWYMAGQRAVESCANLEAIGDLGKALDLLSGVPAGGERTHVELALQTLLGVALMSCKGYGAPEVEAAFRRARELCHDLGEAAQPFPVLRGLWAFAIVRGRLSEARELAGKLLDIARTAGDDALLLETYYALGCTLFYLGEPRASLAWSEQGMALYDPALHRSHTRLYGADPGVTCGCYAAFVLWQLGYPDQALVAARQARALAEETAQPVNIAFALTFGATVHHLRGDVEATRDWAEAAVALATEQVLPFWVSTARVLRGWAWFKSGDSDRGISEIERGLAENRAAGAEIGRLQNCSLLAEVFASKGDDPAALRALAEACDAAAATGARYGEAELHRVRGETLLTPAARCGADPAYAEVEACFRRGIEVACQQDARSPELRCATSLGRLLHRRGMQEEARHVLAPVYAWFTEGFDTRDLREAKALLELPCARSHGCCN